MAIMVTMDMDMATNMGMGIMVVRTMRTPSRTTERVSEGTCLLEA